MVVPSTCERAVQHACDRAAEFSPQRMNSREAATLIWVFVLLAICLRRPDGRTPLANVARAFATPKIIGPVLVYLTLLVGCVIAAARLSLWTPDLVTPTAFWFVLTGMVLLLNIAKAIEEDKYFRKVALRTVSIAAFIEFFYGIKTFNIVVELALQPLIVLLVCVPIVAARHPDQQPAKRLAEVLLAVVGVAVLIFTARALWTDRATIDAVALMRQLALPIWLSLVSIPFLYLLSLYSEYESAFIRLKLGNDMRRPPLRARLALVLEVRNDLRALHHLRNYWGGRISRASTLSTARQEARAFRDQVQQQDAAKREKSDRLIRNEGLPGSDVDGRRYDRREFKETTDALHWLANCHMGWYRRKNRYRGDLLAVLDNFDRQGLPADHGMQMQVRSDGQAWYAYRRTATGWVFGIGAVGAPPDQRFYDGPDVPSGFPGPDGVWGQQAHEQSRNWWG